MEKLSESAERDLLKAIESNPFIMVTDNIRIGRAVTSQRLDNQAVTDNGTAMTVLIMPESSKKAWFDPEAVRAVRSRFEAQMALGTPPSIRFNDLTCPLRQARVLSHKLYHLFDILRAIPEFKDIQILSHPKLSRPPGFHDLEKFISQMHMLRLRPFDESTNAGNIMALRDFLAQLGFNVEDKIIQMTLEMMVPWIGDQLTVARLRGLQWQRQEEPNGYDRLDPFIFIFGWFHGLMCLSSAIFENHRGSAAGLGFLHSVLILCRNGFSNNMRRKRPDYHTVKEYLMHEFEARVRGLWIQGAGKSTLAKLKGWLEDPQRTVDDIEALGQRIQQERISKQAVSFYEIEISESNTKVDDIFRNMLIQNRDLELFWDLRHAIKHGHVGHMEDLLPELLVFFSGSKNSNYAKEMYQLLQVMRHEITPEIRHAIREHCFLVNMEGRHNSFYPIDLRQELNNAGIREFGPAPQGRTSWEDYEKICPLVPFFSKLTRRVQGSVKGIRRQSHIHKVPAWEKDLATLMRDHASTELLTAVPGRELATRILKALPTTRPSAFHISDHV
ncbi:leucine--tRNA ligase [Rhizoctonia solani]|uniref:Leucine--tRNA ligase n=1 Tax=Rhizoctonia solani TaxID=456999 RepID=A0A0K6G590_9AGAM|nr:leucine--tRNA ligase [Rhizoctonia solani]